MKFGRYFALLASLALLLSASAFAKAKDEGKMQLTDPLVVGSTHLKPGSYKVEWNGNGPEVNVNILHDGKTVATTPAKVVNHPTASPYNAVVTKPGRNKTAHLAEIDFSNRKEALVLQPKTMAQK